MATPLRFRRSPRSWTTDRVRRDLLDPLQRNIGASAVKPSTEIGGGWTTHRLDMENGDIALFAHRDEEAYWIGNTETPKSLWGTDKYDWDAVPYEVARWAQRELTSELHREAPWLESFPYVSWFFLPVFMSKDGRDSSRAFFRKHAAGFPDASWATAVGFFEDFLSTGVLEAHRAVMAGKLGTSEHVDSARMNAAMAEFIAAKLLVDAGYRIEPEIEVSTGHSLDFRAEAGSTNVLVEVTRPVNPSNRAAGNAARAMRETVTSKADGQLARHGGGAVLFVDCSSFTDEQWEHVRRNRPSIDHRPALVYRARPNGDIEGYEIGAVPLEVADPVTLG